MSCDVDIFKIKKLENLKIPLSILTEDPDEVEIKHNENKTTTLIFGGDDPQKIKGTIEDKHICIQEICMCRPGSGSFINNILEPALKKSTGVLEMSLGWEDSNINKLIATNGNITWKKY